MNYKLGDKIVRLLTAFLTFNFLLLTFHSPVLAQGLSLAVSPPILEVTISPGKEVTQSFIISALDSEVVLTPRLASFIPEGDFGETAETRFPPPTWVIFDPSPLRINPGGSVRFNIKIAPLANTFERDFYLNLFFESEETGADPNLNASSIKARIASNILITVSKDGLPKKTAEIAEFKAPRVIDSFFPIIYSLKVRNVGNSFFKPTGKIIATAPFAKESTLTISPLNVLSGYSRSISCIEAEVISKCKPNLVFPIGVVKSNLEFGLDEGAVIYKSKTTTFAFPFILVLVLIIIILLLKAAKTASNKHLTSHVISKKI